MELFEWFLHGALNVYHILTDVPGFNFFSRAGASQLALASMAEPRERMGRTKKQQNLAGSADLIVNVIQKLTDLEVSSSSSPLADMPEQQRAGTLPPPIV